MISLRGSWRQVTVSYTHSLIKYCTKLLIKYRQLNNL